jgi:hypothetical protein
LCRFRFLRRQTADISGAALLIDVPGYSFRIFVTSCTAAPMGVWREYNRRADMENASKN